jgi:uncharacterized RDD family membrane protein YckC
MTYPPYEPPANPPVVYANWGQRVGAYLIDAIPVAILYIIGVATRNAIVILLFVLAALGVQIYNRWIQAGRTGQSWGKRALNLRLVSDKTGEPIGAGMAFARDICHIVDSIICYVGWLFPLWDAKRQTIADKIVSTVVIPA